MSVVERRRQPGLRNVPVASQAITLVWQLAESAFTSSVSGLLNKAAFAELEKGAFQAPDGYVVAFGDLSGFKRVNDEFGHTVGDALLAEVGRRLAELIDPGEGTVFHLSGDEFAVVYRSLPSTAQSLERVSQELRRIDLFFGNEARRAEAQLYFGHAGPAPEERLSTLLERAEAAAKVAKSRADGIPVAWLPSFDAEPLDEPRRRCSACGATTRLQVARKNLSSEALRACANCQRPFA